MLGLDELTWTEQWWAACRPAMEPNSCCCYSTPTPAPLYILQQNGSHEHEIMREEISSEAESARSATLSSEGEAHSAHEIPKVWYSSLEAHGNNIGFKKLHLHIWSFKCPNWIPAASNVGLISGWPDASAKELDRRCPKLPCRSKILRGAFLRRRRGRTRRQRRRRQGRRKQATKVQSTTHNESLASCSWMNETLYC